MEIIKLTFISIVWYLNLCSISGLLTKNCRCGKSVSLKARILGGEIAAENDFPWQCAIFYKSKNECGGSLINDRYVLTAAHCFVYESSKSTKVKKRDFMKITIMVGVNFLDDPDAKKVIMSGIDIHPSYNPSTLYADIAICQLEDPIRGFNIFKVLPICLPPKENSFANYKSIVAGFGDTTARMVARLRKTALEVLPDETCKKKLRRKLFYDEDAQMCAAYPGCDACRGDSGGPLISELERKKFYQIGIVSSGVRDCGENCDYPGVYTRVSKFVDWILDKTKDGIFCDK